MHAYSPKNPASFHIEIHVKITFLNLILFPLTKSFLDWLLD